jgi:hypothetical protein
MDNLIFSLLIISGLLAVLNLFLVLCLFKFKKKIGLLFEGKKVKNLEEVLLKQIQKIKEQDSDFKEAFKRIEKLENISEKTFKKIGMVRFNPFSNMGGNQSFTIALLDNQNNGFVISSLFIKEGNRVYGKAVKNGQSDHPLSEEEKEAIEKAMNPKQ